MIFTLSLMNGNYGGVLQAYALQKVISDMGNVVTTNVPYEYRITPRKIAGNILKKLKRATNNNVIFDDSPNRKNDPRVKNLLNFIRNNMDTDDLQRGSKRPRKSLIKKFDIIIVGSDQVWRKKYAKIPTYFLDFAQGLNVKRIAYAASFGLNNVSEYTPKLVKRASKLAKKFDAISVREKSGVSICSENLGVNAQAVIDPTMLIDVKDYTKLVNDDPNVMKSTGEIFTYILDNTAEKNEIINKVISVLGLTSFGILPEKPKSKSDLFNNPEKYTAPTVTQMLKSFIDSKFIITDSFHGCTFSIIFNKPFIAIGNKNRGLERFCSLLKTFNIENRLILSSNELTDELISQSMNWNEINKTLFIEKNASLKFLTDEMNRE